MKGLKIHTCIQRKTWFISFWSGILNKELRKRLWSNPAVETSLCTVRQQFVQEKWKTHTPKLQNPPHNTQNNKTNKTKQKPHTHTHKRHNKGRSHKIFYHCILAMSVHFWITVFRIESMLFSLLTIGKGTKKVLMQDLQTNLKNITLTGRQESLLFGCAFVQT